MLREIIESKKSPNAQFGPLGSRAANQWGAITLWRHSGLEFLHAPDRRCPEGRVRTLHMIWSKDDRKGGRPYHHGNLREALVSAALDLIAEKGPAGFTFAEAARSAGVSAAAPYRHFRDRDELMADIALRGFNLFESALVQAWNNGNPDPSQAFESVGRAYLEFARREPAYYSAMFEAAVPLDKNPELRNSGERVFAVFRAASEKLIASLPQQSKPPATMMGLHMWALSHGVASLFGRGDAARRPLPMAASELLEAALLIYCGGIGLGSPTPPRS